jgi:preprotein translocase subunit SecD
MGKQRFLLALILLVVVGALVVVGQIAPRLGLDLQGGSQLTLQLKTTDKIKQIEPRVLEAVQKVVENRINGLGVAESVVQTAGEDKLLVQLPGVNDPKEAERVLQGTAQLDFRSQREGSETQLVLEQQLLAEAAINEITVKASNDPKLIEEAKAKLKRQQDAVAALFDKTGLTGEMLRDASAAPRDATGTNWVVNISFTPEGSDMFTKLTKQIATSNMTPGKNRTLGIFLDDKLLSAPKVGPEYAQTGISGGAEISGNFTSQSANELAIQLRGGSLPVPLDIAEIRTVGATLGQDSIRSSIIAGLGGLALVLVFMAVYYRLPGLIANLALSIYALLTYALFLLFGVTLTLPGIAGFILSIGMAVDANVLIFERTREELRAGKSLYRAVESGFYRAFSSILDSNVTTVIACVALFVLGSGLVKGFAVTLGMGVMVSMFTAITCSRTFLMLVLTIPSLRKPKYFCPKVEAVR